MTDRELMQQALDALELVTARMLDCRDELAERGVRPQTNAKHQTLWDLAFTAYTDSAIPIAETLRARLAQPAYRRGDRLLCLETDEHCIIHVSGTDQQWVKFPDSHVGVYTNDQVAEMFELMPSEFNPDWDAMAVMVEEQQRMAKRIEELEGQLAQLAQQEPTDKTGSPCTEFWDWLPKAYRDGDKGNERKFTKYNMEVAYLAGKQSQPEQEPVAWGIANTRPTEKNPLMLVMLDEPEPSHLVVPLYTAPPQREWQGLTDEEIRKQYRDSWSLNMMHDFARAIEAKLKERNV